MAEAVVEQPPLDGLHQDLKFIGFRELVLEELPNSVLLPSKELVEQVRKNGILQAISVMQDDDGAYIILEGRRRVVAARENDMDTIPALVFEGSPLFHALSLIANNVRSENPVSDLDAILSLLASGYQENEIALELGIPVGIIKRRTRLASLRPELMEALQTLHLGIRLAEKIALLTKQQQDMLVAIYQQTGRLTSADVKDVIDATTPESEKATQTTMSDVDDKDWRKALRVAVASARENGIPFEAFQAAMVAAFEDDLSDVDVY